MLERWAIISARSCSWIRPHILSFPSRLVFPNFNKTLPPISWRILRNQILHIFESVRCKLNSCSPLLSDLILKNSQRRLRSPKFELSTHGLYRARHLMVTPRGRRRDRRIPYCAAGSCPAAGPARTLVGAGQDSGPHAWRVSLTLWQACRSPPRASQSQRTTIPTM